LNCCEMRAHAGGVLAAGVAGGQSAMSSGSIVNCALAYSLSMISVRSLAQGDDEIRAFAGFALINALIGHDDRSAGRQRFRDPRHDVGGNADSVERLCRAVSRRRRLGFIEGASVLPPPSAILAVVVAYGTADRDRQRDDGPLQSVGIGPVDFR